MALLVRFIPLLDDNKGYEGNTINLPCRKEEEKEVFTRTEDVNIIIRSI